jgi:radical SAM superfamily enzyme YgiQ (UPF0313 family)
MNGAERFTLVTALIVPEEEAEDPRERIQLGPLCVAASAREISYHVDLVNLNSISARHQGGSILLDQEAFLNDATHEILERNNRLIGLGTICSSFRLTLRLVQRLKKQRPDSFIFLGGPQATAVDMRVLEIVPELDAVLRGEADLSIRDLLRALDGGESLGTVPGLSWRGADGALVRNPAGDLLADMDALPFPAYDLYPAHSYSGGIALDAGRGCPFGCTFCSTNEFFRRRFRMKSPARLAFEINRLNELYNATQFSLTHDLFTTNVKTVREICAAFREQIRFEGLGWTASARIDSMKGDLAQVMADAGCRNLFFGVETASQEMQTVIKKRLTVSQIMPVLKQCSELGMECTASIIIGYPEERREDIQQSISLAVNAVGLSNVKSQIHLLVPLPGTPLALMNESKLVYSDLSSNIATVGGTEITDAERTFIENNKLIFTQHFYVPNERFDRSLLYHVAQVTFFGTALHRHTSLALEREEGGFTEFAFRWAEWIKKNANVPDYLWEAFYRGEHFGTEFRRFVRAFSATWNSNTREILETLIQFDVHIGRHLTGEFIRDGSEVPARAGDFSFDGRFLLASGISIESFNHDLNALLAALEKGLELPPTLTEPSWYLFHQTRSGRINFTAIHEQLASILNLCDGNRTLNSVIEEVRPPRELLGHIVSRIALMLSEGLLVVAKEDYVGVLTGNSHAQHSAASSSPM